MTGSKTNYLTWWRDRARALALLGLAVYAAGF